MTSDFFKISEWSLIFKRLCFPTPSQHDFSPLPPLSEFFCLFCLFTYLAALGLSCSMWDFHASCGIWHCGRQTLQWLKDSGVAVSGLSYSRHVGIFVPDQGLNLCPLHCKANSQPLDHQGGPSVVRHFKVKVLVAQLCPALCNPMDHSPPGSYVRGILQAKILAWVAIPFSRSSQPRN